MVALEPVPQPPSAAVCADCHALALFLAAGKWLSLISPSSTLWWHWWPMVLVGQWSCQLETDRNLTEWGVLLLFGGGLCLSAVLQKSRPACFWQGLLALLDGVSSWWIVLAICHLCGLLDRTGLNTATAALMVPLFGSMAGLLRSIPR